MVDRLAETLARNSEALRTRPIVYGLNGVQPAQPASGAQHEGNPLSKCDAYRVQIAGGQLLTLVNNPSLTPIEQVYRKLPQDGVFTAVPSKPFTIELGAFEVPDQMALVVLDYRFDIYRFSGMAVGDFVPLENRRLPISVGHDMVFSSRRPGNYRYETVPSLPSPSKEAFSGSANAGSIPGGGPSRAPQNQFDQIAFQRAQSPAGQGLSMMPQRHNRVAQLTMPFTYVVPSNQRIQLLTIIYQPVQIPIAFFEGEWSGLLVSSNVLSDFLASVAPCAANLTGGK